MKITVLLTIVAIQASALGYAQKRITLSEKNAQLGKVLKLIGKQSGFDLVFISTDINQARPVTVNFKDVSLHDALIKCFINQPFVYAISNESIVVQEKKAPVELRTADPVYKIGGQVKDELNNPMPGVNIRAINGTRKAMTNGDGKYTIEVDFKDTLEFSYVGYKAQLVPVRNRVDINVVMEPNKGSLDEIKVVGYGKQKSSQLVSSISSISGEQLKLPNRSIQNGLAGQVAGLIAVQRSGQPGYDNAEIFIRGISSFAGGTAALILVDGIPRKITDISPEEIETFTVLKDASATAVYGAEGANGVVLVTSKRGKNQKTNIDFRADYYINEPTRVLKFQNSAAFLRMYNEAKWNTEGNPTSGFIPFASDDKIAKYESGEDPDLYPNTNWMDLLNKTASNQRYSLNFRGGGDKLRFFVASSFLSEEGLFKSNPLDANEFSKEAKYSTNIGVKRYNLRSNVDLDVSKSTLLRVDISGQYLTTNYPGIATSTIFTNMLRSSPYLVPMVYSNGYPSKAVNSAAYDNPYTQLNFSGYAKEFRVALQTNVGIEQQLNFIPGLYAKANVSFDSDFQSSVSRGRTASQYLATGRDANGNLIFSKVVNGLNTAAEASGGGISNGNKKIYMEASLNYNKTFGVDHSISGLLLGMQKETQLQNVPYLYRKQGIVGRTSYAFKDRYFLDASFGFTGSENFAPGNRFGFFPAIGVGYTITNENFIKEQAKSIGIDRLKFRFSIGKTGNDQVSNGRFPYKENLNWTGYPALFLGMSSSGGVATSNALLTENQAFNPSIHWEVEEKRNVGIDLTMFNGALDLSADYFNNFRHDILLQRNTVSAVAGLMSNPYQNYGKMSNKGFDASLNVKRTFGKVDVSMRGTFTYAHNKILEMDEVSRLFAYQNQTGYSLGVNDAWIAERLYTEDDFDVVTQPSNGAKTYTLKPSLPQLGVGFGTVAPGNIKYTDLNGDNIIDNNDWTRNPEGSRPTIPEIIYGFGLNFSYKGFYVGSFFQGAANATIYLNPTTMMIPFAATDPSTTSAKAFASDRWSVANPDANAMIPRLQLGTNNNDNRKSTWWLRSGDYLRFRNLELGYSFNKKMLERVGVKALRVYVLGQNLAVWDKAKFWDPEQANSTDYINYPLQRSYNFGLELTF